MKKEKGGGKGGRSLLWQSHLRLRREKHFAESAHVSPGDLNASVGKSQLVEAAGIVLGANVALSGER